MLSFRQTRLMRLVLLYCAKNEFQMQIAMVNIIENIYESRLKLLQGIVLDKSWDTFRSNLSGFDFTNKLIFYLNKYKATENLQIGFQVII